MKLFGKTALITGGTTGIGREIARIFAREGANLCLNYLNNTTEAETFRNELIKTYNVKVFTYSANVTIEADVQDLVTATLNQFGRLDILVCCAGINHQISMQNMTFKDWELMISANLTSVFLCNHYALSPMLEQKYGRIINITSQLGQIGGINSAHYSAAKAGVIGLTKSLAREVGTCGITANCIAPGPITTPFFFQGCSEEWRQEKLASLPLGRFGCADEVAPTALLLASDPDGNLYTGQTLGPNSGDVML